MPEEQVEGGGAPVARAKQNNLGIPVAIIIAAALIAAAIYFGGPQNSPVGIGTGKDLTAQVTPEISIEPVSDKDVIRGNPEAPIVIVEYSDYDCPYCKFFHETMVRIMEKYGADGKVAWVYRQFPIEGLHPNAPKISAAAKCATELGGNDAFWKFSDTLFDSRTVVGEGQNQRITPTDMTKLRSFAETAGVDGNKFDLCLNSGKYDDEVKADVAAAAAAGAQGTPHSILMIGSENGVINGAQPYETVDQIIGNLLQQLESGQAG